VFLLDADRVAQPAMQLSVERLALMPSAAPGAATVYTPRCNPAILGFGETPSTV